MAEKATIMVLKVDLECPCCYKKVKKILCKFPQIRDQVFDVKTNTVTIKVVCCDPERIRDKLCCKGAKVIKSIDILDPPKPPEKPKPEAEKPKPKEPEKPKPEAEKPKPKEPEKPTVVVVEEPKKPEKPKVTFVEPPPPKEPEKPPPPAAPAPAPAPPPPQQPAPTPPPPQQPAPTPPPPEPICGYPPAFPARTCCGPCSEGYGGGPCYFGYGVAPPPPQPQPCFDGYYGYGYHDRPCHVTRCDYYFSEENPQSCSIM